MKKWIAGILVCLLLLGLAGCKEEVKDIPELLDVAQVKRDAIFSIKAYDGQIVPYVEQLQFQIDGKLKELNVVLGDSVTKGQVLATLNEDHLLSQMETLEEEIARINTLGSFSDRQTEANIKIAKVELEKLQAQGASEKDQALKALEIEKLTLKLRQEKQLRLCQVEEKQEQLDSIREKTGKNLLTAPCDGRVVYLGLSGEGTSVQGYKTVIAITDDSKLYLQTESIPDAVISGMDQIYARIGDQEYALTHIPYDPDEYFYMILAGEKVKTRFAVQAPEGTLESGQTAVILAKSQHKEDVLVIPVNALFWDGDNGYVYKVVDGNRIRCDVTVGVLTNLEAEITSGLEEGDMVYVKG